MLDRGRHQAAGLAQAFAARAPRVIACPIAAGQPVHWVARVARGLRAAGHRPVVLDATGGLLARTFGLRPRHELVHLLRGDCDFDTAAQCTPDGVWVLRGEQGLETFVQSGKPPSKLLDAFARLSHGFDGLLLAMPPGELASIAPAAVPAVGLAPGAPALLSAYGVLKRLAQEFGYRRFTCALHGDPSPERAQEQWTQLAGVAHDFLDADVSMGAWLPPGDRDAAALGHAARSLMDAACAA